MFASNLHEPDNHNGEEEAKNFKTRPVLGIKFASVLMSVSKMNKHCVTLFVDEVLVEKTKL